MNTMRFFSLHFLLLLVVMFFHQGVSAQELSVRSMDLLPDDPTAMLEENQLLEKLNNKYAGIVKVYVALEGVEFYGAGVLKQKKEGLGEYWVWLADDGTKLIVRAPGYLPLEVNFRQYGIVVHSKKTYKLVLVVSNLGFQPQDDGNSYLALKVEPVHAKVIVDGKERQSNNGEYMLLVSRGFHEYEVTATGYSSQKGRVEVGSEKKELPISLVSTLAQLKVECPTSGAKVYVNDQLKGTVPWNGCLGADTYRVEVRLDGYRSQSKTVALTENNSRTLSFPPMTALTGNLNVAISPMGSEVYVDGKKLGTSPDIFRNIVIGHHRVELRKEGYQTGFRDVELKESETFELSGSLTALSTPAQNNQSNVSNNASSQESTGVNVETFAVNGVSFRMVRVEGGTFQMGATAEQGIEANNVEKPVHSVTLSEYMIGETEVTQELWEAVMGSNPSWFKSAKNPVESVSWNDCQTFIIKLNQLTGKQFRLPTEAEWEFAARGGNRSGHYKYSGSNKIRNVAWYKENSGNSTHEVGKKRPNELGLFDMSGNVREWCEDWYGHYSGSSQTNPKGASLGTERVLRGGCMYYSATICRVSNRYSSKPDHRGNLLGLRLAF